MHYSNKKPLEAEPLEMTVIWTCSNEKCKGWMRDNFAFSAIPECPHCHSSMVKGEKMLAAVVNTSPNQVKG